MSILTQNWNVVSAIYLMLFDVVAFTLQSPMCYARMTFHTLNETKENKKKLEKTEEDTEYDEPIS